MLKLRIFETLTSCNHVLSFCNVKTDSQKKKKERKPICDFAFLTRKPSTKQGNVMCESHMK